MPEDYPKKKCNFCLNIGKAYTFMNGITICPKCFDTVSADLDKCWKEIFQLRKRLNRIGEIIEIVDNRCLAADGEVIATLDEMTQDEISEIYKLANIKDKNNETS